MKPVINFQHLQAMFSRMSKRERAVLYAVAVFISLGLFDRVIIAPIASTVSALDKQIKEREANIRKNMRIVAQKDKIAEEAGKYASYATTADSDDEQMTAILREVETLASKSSVYIADMKPGAPKTVGMAKKLIISLNCEAQMEQLIQFMYDLESSNQLLTIEKYQLGPKSKDSSVAKCSMSVSKMAVPK